MDAVRVRERARASMLDPEAGGAGISIKRFPKHVANLLVSEESVRRLFYFTSTRVHITPLPKHVANLLVSEESVRRLFYFTSTRVQIKPLPKHVANLLMFRESGELVLLQRMLHVCCTYADLCSTYADVMLHVFCTYARVCSTCAHVCSRMLHVCTRMLQVIVLWEKGLIDKQICGWLDAMVSLNVALVH